MFTIYITPEIANIRNKMEKGSTKLEDAVTIISYGLNTSDNKKYFVDKKINDNYKKAVMGRDIERWVIKNRNKFVYYDQSVLTRAGDVNAFTSKEKIIMQRIGAGLIAAYDNEQYYCYNSTNMLLPKTADFELRFILALLNSSLIDSYYRLVFGIKAGLTVNVTQGYLSQIPIKIASTEKLKQILSLVNEIIKSKRREIDLKDKNTDEKAAIIEKIAKMEATVNELVYDIYGITEKERRIIERNLG
jgi:adenine-specific DNA-methyltransferase